MKRGMARDTNSQKGEKTRLIIIVTVVLLFFGCILTIFLLQSRQDFTTPAIPFVRMNDNLYFFSYTRNFLSDDYIQIGEIIGEVNLASEAQNGESFGCKIGEAIFQSPQNTDEIFVYTKLFSGDEYRYVRFVTSNNTRKE